MIQITKQEAIDLLDNLIGMIEDNHGSDYDSAIRMAIDVLKNQPEIIRCKDCKHRVYTEDGESNPHDIVCHYHMSDGFDETDFCSYAERKE